METFIEEIIIYGSVILLCLIVLLIYLRKIRRGSRKVEAKIVNAKRDGIHEPVSLHPVIDPNSCIATGACIIACPEKDILGILKGKATTINTSQCIGHGACFHACPTHAISLNIGTEKRGVDLPHINQHFETNVPGISIAGELGGMGLIKNAVEQGRQAVEHIAKTIDKTHRAPYDLIVVGAGPAGISAALTAKKYGLKALTLEQDTLGGTVFSFPRKKVVMTSPMDLPLYGKIKLFETNKIELLNLWNSVLTKHEIVVMEKSKVEAISFVNNAHKVVTLSGEEYVTKHVLLAIGRRGTPRKLNIPGEGMEKVAYRLLEPENISNENIVVVGGGDSAVEAAMLLAEENNVTLSYRKEGFQRIKPKNGERIREAMNQGKIDVKFNSNVEMINWEEVVISIGNGADKISMKNDRIYIFAGGELPTQFLDKIGIQITKKFGEAILKHN
jgi:thioredoxin reductase (NADPH)